MNIQVQGLVFPDSPNDEAYFRALVSCQAVKNNTVVTKNLITGPFRTGGRHNNHNLIAKGNANTKPGFNCHNPV